MPKKQFQPNGDADVAKQPLRVFFSSRMQELSYDRMLLIEAINDNDHWPRFLENESHRDKKSIKDPIDSLIDDSDAFVLVTYLTSGHEIQLFGGLTPIEYELARFKKKSGPVLWLVKSLPAGIMPKGNDQFAKLDGIFKSFRRERRKKIAYSDPLDARDELGNWLRKQQKSQQPRGPLPRFIIRCSTTDCLGQINLITKFLVERRFNVDYIDQAAKAGKATVYISASQRGDNCINVSNVADRNEFERHLRQNLRNTCARKASKYQIVTPW